MNKILLIAAALLSAGSLQAQVTLLADTAFTTGINKGVRISHPATGFNVTGENANRSVGTLIADDFTVPNGEKWTINEVTVYGYQTQVTPPFNTTPTLSMAYLMIFAGKPGVAGTTVKYGDTTTNRLTTATYMGIQRQFTSAIDTDRARPLMAIKMTLGSAAVLNAGTYWLAYGFKGNSLAGPYSPIKVSPTKTNPAGANGLKLGGTAWAASVDGSNTVGFNMLLRGTKQASSAVPGVPGAGGLTLSNAPNPVRGVTYMSFHIPAAMQAKLSVYDAAGRLVRIIAEDRMATGDNLVPFNAAGLAGGMYYYKLEAGGQSLTRSMQVE